MPDRDDRTRAEAVVDALYLLYAEELDPEEFTLFPDAGDGPARAARKTDTTADAGGTEEEPDGSDDPTTAWESTYGGQDAFECLVRTILSQNTSDAASRPAHEELMARYGGDGDLAAALAHAERADVADAISAAGLYDQKSERIVAIADRVLDEFGSAAAFDRYVKDGGPAEVRETLLSYSGVGPKTADCVLLFAGGREGVFPVDTHVHRIYRRLGIAPADADHETVREVLEREVPAEKCGFGHTASIQFGREYCSARKPACLDGAEACPLASVCDRVGVAPAEGTVVDPAEAED